MSAKSVRTFKESRKLSYQSMCVLSTEFLRSRGMLKRYARWLSGLSDACVRTFVEDHRDSTMTESRRKRAERNDADRPLLDVIEAKETKPETYARKVSGAIKEYVKKREGETVARSAAMRITPALKRRLEEMRSKPSYEPLPAEGQEEPMPEKKS